MLLVPAHLTSLYLVKLYVQCVDFVLISEMLCIEHHCRVSFVCVCVSVALFSSFIFSAKRPVIHLIMNSLVLVELNYINIFIFQTHYIAMAYL